MRSQPRRKRRRVPRLHEHRPGARKLTHQPLATAHITDNPARRRALEHVVAIPRHQMPVVNNILLTLVKLHRD